MASLDVPLLEYEGIPEGLLESSTNHIREVVAHPSLFYLKGKRPETIFLSLALHGNEHTSFLLLKKIILYLRENKLSRNMIIFLGNVYALEKNKRFLDGQEDYNRIWHGGSQPEHQLAKKVLEKLNQHSHNLFASIDVHNNTGVNPLYACFSKRLKEHIYLASLFSKTNVFFEEPSNALSVVMSDLCPSVTLECGMSGEVEGLERAYQFVLDVLRLESLSHPVKNGDTDVFHTKVKILVPKDLNIAFAKGKESNLSLPENFEMLNFTELKAGDCFARTNLDYIPLRLMGDDQQDHTMNYLELKGDSIVLKRDFYASMFTKNLEVIRQDCLGYLMEKL